MSTNSHTKGTLSEPSLFHYQRGEKLHCCVVTGTTMIFQTFVRSSALSKEVVLEWGFHESLSVFVFRRTPTLYCLCLNIFYSNT